MLNFFLVCGADADARDSNGFVCPRHRILIRPLVLHPLQLFHFSVL